MAEQGQSGNQTARAESKKLLRLVPLTPNDLPPHPDLQSHQSDPPSLESFLGNLAAEAQQEDFSEFQKIGTVKFKVTSAGKDYPTPVDKIKKKDKDGGMWFARRSLHEEGEPVTYEELDRVIRQDHDHNEMAYTPTIYECNVLCDWAPTLEAGIDGLEAVEMRRKWWTHA